MTYEEVSFFSCMYSLRVGTYGSEAKRAKKKALHGVRSKILIL